MRGALLLCHQELKVSENSKRLQPSRPSQIQARCCYVLPARAEICICSSGWRLEEEAHPHRDKLPPSSLWPLINPYTSASHSCLSPPGRPVLFSFLCWGAPNTPSPGTCATPSRGFWEHPYPLHLEEAIRAVSDLQLPCPGTCSPGEAQVQRPHIAFSHPVMQKNQAPAGPPSCFPHAHELH